MDTRIVVGIILLFVVAFFGYQWWKHVSKSVKPRLTSSPSLSPSPSSSSSSSPSKPAADPEYPVVAGQTEAELRAKEPLQTTNGVSQQEPVTYEGHGPAEFDSNIRHPEQSFHQPSPQRKNVSNEIESGRAVSSPAPEEQGFSPEMAQNDGPLVGNVFAFDGMEQTGFATF
jgi:hypothetical protein